MEAEKIDRLARDHMDKEEADKAIAEKKLMEKIPEFAAYFRLGGKIREGQKAKGFMAMPDCELFLRSMQIVYNSLKLFVKHENNPLAEENLSCKEPELAGEEIFHAYGVLKVVMETMQGTGIMELEDSVISLHDLRMIESVLVENMDPVFKSEQLKQNMKEKKEEMQNKRKPKGKGNKKR